MELSELQRRQPWTVPYREGFTAMGNHAVLHAAKTCGKLAAVFEAQDHGATVDVFAIRDGACDLVTAAMRLANLYGFDLENHLMRRVKEKNGVGFEDATPAENYPMITGDADAYRDAGPVGSLGPFDDRRS